MEGMFLPDENGGSEGSTLNPEQRMALRKLIDNVENEQEMEDPGRSSKELIYSRGQRMIDHSEPVFARVREGTLDKLFFEAYAALEPDAVKLVPAHDNADREVAGLEDVIAGQYLARIPLATLYNHYLIRNLDIHSLEGLKTALQIGEFEEIEPDLAPRMYAWNLQKQMEHLKKENKEKFKGRISELKKSLMLLAVEPFTDEEVREILRKIIRKLSKNGGK